MSKSEEFDFDEAGLMLDEKDLDAMDQQFLQSIQQKSDDVSAEDANNAFTFWFLIIMLLLFIFFLAMGAVMIVKGRRRRYEYAVVGYR
jgi:heme/copper-type cytochrome/quinol oxidase subunit 2